MTILNVERPGRYRFEFFSTYPFYDLTRDGKDEQGGIIKEFTTEVRSVAGKRTFTVPPLWPLGYPPYAPDYGFKAIWLPKSAPPTVALKGIAPKAPAKAKAPVQKPAPSGWRK